MVVGIPLLANRVAPRCTSATHLLLATVTGGRVSAQRVVAVAVDNTVALIDTAQVHGIGTLVCGGITADDRALLQAQGLEVVDNVACSASEALAAMDAGSLRPGFGFAVPPVQPQRRAQPVAEVGGGTARSAPVGVPDCLACADRVCLRGERCGEAPTAALPPMPLMTRRLLEASADISLEHDRHLCRVAELVYLCLEMELTKVGIAFCVDLLEPAEILAGVLRRFVTVVPVCCKIGGSPPLAAGDGDALGQDLGAVPCNPLLQAQTLNLAGTELNIMVGLCVGADCVFTSASQAPVTALFVKDRSLANNPIGAIYSQYYLQECLAPRQPQRPANDQARAELRRRSDHLAREAK